MFNKNKKGGFMNSLMKTNGNLVPTIPSLLNDFFSDGWIYPPLSGWKSTGTTLPAANICETNEDFRIEIAAPGMKRDDFKVELDNHVLTVSYERNEQQTAQNQETYSLREFNYQSFQRTFTLPEQKIQGEKIEARYDNGILYISIPKKDEAKIKPARQITIS
jgi:HSP20 family protein